MSMTNEEMKSLCTYWREMAYSVNGTSCVLARGRFSGFNFLVINTRGHNPCGYVNVGGTALNGIDYDEINIDCHGGLTFSEKYAPVTCESGWWIGWDYLHFGDYDPRELYDGYTKTYTTADVVRECLRVIQQVVEICKKGGE